MTTTFTDSLGIKKIGSGLEENTWGESNNENFERLEAAIGGISTINVTAMPTSSTSAASTGGTAVWVTVDQATQGAVGSEGRCSAVSVTGTVTGTITLEIRGANSGVTPSRTMIVKNDMTGGQDLVLSNGLTSSVTISPGISALVVVTPSFAGGVADGVTNLLDDVQFTSMSLVSAVDFLTAPGRINLLASNTALNIGVSSSTNQIEVDTNNDKVTIGGVSFNFAQAASIVAESATNASALSVTDGTDDYLVVDTTATKKLHVGSANVNTHLESPSVDITNQTSSVSLKTAEATAFTIEDLTEGQKYLEFDTDVEKIDVSVGLNLKQLTGSLNLAGNGSYMNFDTTLGSGGYGIRNNAGDVETKNSGGAWNRILLGMLASTTAASGSEGSFHHQFAFDIGPIRVIGNTVPVSGNISVTLGDSGTGTAHEMSSRLYTVMVCQQGDTNGDSRNVGSRITGATGSGTQEFTIYSGSTDYVSYVAIGDSE